MKSLKKLGYATGFLGKWHLAGEGSVTTNNGVVNSDYHPEHYGFDSNVGGCAYGQPKSWFDPYRNGTIKNRKQGVHLTDRLGDEAASFIQANKDKPFHLTLWPYSVHTPIRAPKDLVKTNGGSNYRAMLESLDNGAGKVLDALKATGTLDNTMVVFYSDNGGHMPTEWLADKKASLLEGGLRVPMVVSWPGVVKGGTSVTFPSPAWTFLNLWWLVPHKPYEPAPEPHWSNTAADGISDDQHRFRSMVQHMDAKVGQILRKLDELRIADNTLVLFTSDNGAAYEGFIHDLKGGKTDLHDGGLRVPMVVRWPAAIPAGQTSDAFGHTNDLLPTFCEAAGVETPSELPIDGLSLLPHMKGEHPPSAEARGTVFWQLNLYRNIQRHNPKPKPYATEVAMRGKWKLLALGGKPVELFDIEADPNEQRNVIDDHPDLVESLTAQVNEWLNAPRTTK